MCHSSSSNPHLISSHLISSHLISSHLISTHLISYQHIIIVIMDRTSLSNSQLALISHFESQSITRAIRRHKVAFFASRTCNTNITYTNWFHNSWGSGLLVFLLHHGDTFMSPKNTPPLTLRSIIYEKSIINLFSDLCSMY